MCETPEPIIVMLFPIFVLHFPDPYHPRNKLKYRIKLASNTPGRADPAVCIEIPFDHYTFMGGMRRAGKMKHGCEV